MPECNSLTGLEVAVVGIAGRFPQADNVNEYWQNLLSDSHCISHFSEDALRDAGLSRDKLNDPAFVPHKGVLNRTYEFDPAFFGYSAREAACMDPQLRGFHEVVWHALEDSGYVAGQYSGQVGLFAGCGNNTFWMNRFIAQMSSSFAQNYEVSSLNSRDFLATRVAYALNLTGPAITLQTACSTSLVAVHQAVQSLLSGECDLAIAGGAAIHANGVDERADVDGYTFQEGMILSPDGVCRPFDSQAQGTVQGDGIGAVALKRLDDAEADGDSILAVIKGTGVNNDGNNKVGYTAPSPLRQADLIRTVQELAEVPSHTISFIENHGTGTPLGDPIELEALRAVFAEDPLNQSRSRACLLGSVKSNIGHLDAAAGVAGFIKAVLALKHRVLPASLHVETVNPKLKLEGSPFEVNTQRTEFDDSEHLRASVSAFGIGGTNAHVILEEYKAPEQQKVAQPSLCILPISAKSETAANRYLEVLKDHITGTEPVNLPDVAATLAHHRTPFPWRNYLVATQDHSGQIHVEQGAHAKLVPNAKKTLVWAFPGQGSQYSAMAQNCYRTLEVFKHTVDRCLKLVHQDLAAQLRQYWLEADEPSGQLDDTELAQPALFICQYALAKQLKAWGIPATSFIGHSLGEYVAATLAEVFSLEDALRLVVARGALMAQASQGAMTSVIASLAEVEPLLGKHCHVSAFNSATNIVVGGGCEAIAEFETRLQRASLAFTRLRTSHAYHTDMMQEAAEAFREYISKAVKHAPTTSVISNVTGTWLTAEQAQSDDYWVEHILAPVQLEQGCKTLLSKGAMCVVEVGPGKSLCTLISSHADWNEHCDALALLPGKKQGDQDLSSVFSRIGELFQQDLLTGWENICDSGRRVSVPEYQFSPTAFDPPALSQKVVKHQAPNTGLMTWAWQSELLPTLASEVSEPGLILLFAEQNDDSRQLRDVLIERGYEVISAFPGHSYQLDRDTYSLDFAQEFHFEQLIKSLINQDKLPSQIVWANGLTDCDSLEQAQNTLFFAPIYFARQWDALAPDMLLRINFITQYGIQVQASEKIVPHSAFISGPLRVIPQELDKVSCRHLDIQLPSTPVKLKKALHSLCEQIESSSTTDAYAIRYPYLWKASVEPVAEIPDAPFSPAGHYLVVGATSGIGSTLTKHLAKHQKLRLSLTGRKEVQGSQTISGFINALKSSQCEVSYQQLDVLDREAFAEVVSCAVAQFGPLTGVIYCPGVPDGTAIHRLSERTVEPVFAPKVRGVENLFHALQGKSVEQVVLCSSITALLGGFGQAAYTAANAFVDAFAQDKAQSFDGQIICLNWDTWKETGMATGRNGLSQFSDQHALGELIFEDSSSVHYKSTLSAQQDWLLNEHWIMGKPTLAGATYLELVREAVSRQTGQDAMVFSDVYFMTPLVAQDDGVVTLITELAIKSDGFEFTVKSGASRQTVHARGSVRLGGNAAAQRKQVDLNLWRNDCRAREIENLSDMGALARINTVEENDMSAEVVTFGAHWQNIQAISLGESTGIASMALPSSFIAEVDKYHMHPAMLDVATAFLRPFHKEGIFIPLSYGSLTLLQPLPATFEAKATLKSVAYEGDSGAQKASLCFDIVMVDEEGRHLIEVTDFVLREIDLASLEQSVNQGQGLDNPMFKHNALSNQEALALFERATMQPFSQLIISNEGLEERRQQLEASKARAQQPKSRQPRPDIATAYIEPKTEVEKTIAALWQELLALEQVGSQDDFFELGGNSLLLVQFHKRLKGEFENAMPVVDLYTHTTVAAQAELLTQLLEPQEDTSHKQISERAMRQKAARSRRRSKR